MARGWESKAVENQISEREAGRPEPGPADPTPQEKERRSRLSGLRLARIHAENARASSWDERYRALLQFKLDHLDAEIAGLEKT